MTTAAEAHDAQLAAIKARHDQVRAKFSDPAVTSISAADCNGMMLVQMGLEPVAVDTLGRFWKMARDGAEMVFDPHGPSGPSGDAIYHGDTPATEGLLPHERPLTPETLKREINMDLGGRSWSCSDVQFFDHLRRVEATIVQGERTTILAYPNRKMVRTSDVADIVEGIYKYADAWANRAPADDTQAAQGFPAKEG